ncbi:uncharacterized protein VP01_3066g3 [Puccinia sorghi]|uniref:Uncharacterized protein n=1 Tax=Puccinia sorghi TaxID=27349 RepID=A0A0L6UZS6_9BASI|nr:uncharacterized protein VP01_3066g3 [Puccinia sorghi]
MVTREYHNRPEIGTLERFDRIRGAKAKKYGFQVVLYIVSKPSIFPDNCSKIIFAISYLWGAASSWAIPFTNRVLKNNPANPFVYKNLNKQFMALPHTKKYYPSIGMWEVLKLISSIEFCTVAKFSNLALRIDAEINRHETSPQ